MDRETVLELLPHYGAMLVLVFVALAAIQATVGEVGFWTEFAVVVVIVMLYRPVVRRLGYAPSAWRD